MANVFLFGPYAWISAHGMPPGADHHWWFGPWSWYANAITVTAHPLASGDDRQLGVTSTSIAVKPNGDRMVYATVHNFGPDAANYAVWVGGVAP